MKDIDFDELDKAVSSLMGSVPKDEPAAEPDETNLVISDSSATVPTIDESEQGATVPAVDTESLAVDVEPVIVPSPEVVVDQEPEPLPTSSTTATPPVSRGRFMDVVRPSREMRKPTMPISRQGVTLQPSMPTQPTEPVNSSEMPDQQTSQTLPDFAAQAAVSEEREDTASVATPPTSSFIATPPTSSENTSEVAEDTEDSSPLSSPFLPDAKVEKRPLGRPVETTPAVDLASELAKEAPQSTVEPFVAALEEPSLSPDRDAQLPEEPLPAELDSKLLSIETDGDVLQKEVQQPQNDTPEMAVPPAASVEATPPQADISRAMAAASIPQQYKLETMPNEEAPAGAIYDTQPLAHPAKSKPSWLLVAAIIGILVIGAGLGALVYYLGLI